MNQLPSNMGITERLIESRFRLRATALFVVFASVIFLFCPIPAFSQELDELRQELENQRIAEQNSPYRLTGQVTGPTGPAENVTVNLEVRDVRDRRPFLYLNEKTDPQGYFSFDLSSVTANEIAMEIYTTSYRYTMSRWFERIPRNELPLNAIINVNPGVVVRGQVLDENDEPIEGVLLSGTDIVSNETKENGEFEIFGLFPEGHNIIVEKEGYTQVSEYIRNETAGVIEDYIIRMKSSEKFQGTVTNWKNEPVGSARIVFQMMERYQEERTDREGKFAFVGIPKDAENVYINIYPMDEPPHRHYLSKEEQDTGEVDLQLSQPSGIAGRILLPSGYPAAGSSVYVEMVLENDTPFFWNAKADADGYFHLDDLLPGNQYNVTISPSLLNNNFAMADLDITEGNNGSIVGEVWEWPEGHSSDFEIEKINADSIRLVRHDRGEGGFGGEAIYTGSWNEKQNIFSGDMMVEALGLTGKFFLQPRGTFPDNLVGEWIISENYDPLEICYEQFNTTIDLPMIPVEKMIVATFEEGTDVKGRILSEEGSFAGGFAYIIFSETSPDTNYAGEIDFDGFFEINCVPQGIAFIYAVGPEPGAEIEPLIFSTDDGFLELNADDDSEESETFTLELN